MIKKLLSLVILCSILLTGCFNYRDINRVPFATCVVIDIDETGNPVIYYEVFRPFRSEEKSSAKARRILHRSSGPTLFTAIRESNMASSYKINFMQNRAIVFTKDAAEYGLDKFIDLLDRDQEFILRQYIFICDEEPEDLLTMELDESQFIGSFLGDMIVNQQFTSRTPRMRIDAFYNRRLLGDKVVELPFIIKIKNSMGEKLKIGGTAVIKDDKMVSTLDSKEGLAHNIMTGQVEASVFTIPNPKKPDKLITLELLKNKTKNEVSYVDGVVRLKTVIQMRTTIGEIQGGLAITPEVIRQMAQSAEQYIAGEATRLFEKYKEKGVDIFDIETAFEKKYTNIKMADVIKNTQLDLEVHVFIEGSSDKTDFLDF